MTILAERVIVVVTVLVEIDGDVGVDVAVKLTVGASGHSEWSSSVDEKGSLIVNG